jgi:myo-inositol-1(or 4)-monophosphatase
MSDLAALLPIAHAAVDAAADLARTSPPGILTPKGDRDYASEVDFAIERTVRDFLDRQTPGIAFVGEEENASASEKAEWVDARPDRRNGELRRAVRPDGAIAAPPP